MLKESVDLGIVALEHSDYALGDEGVEDALLGLLEDGVALLVLVEELPDFLGHFGLLGGGEVQDELKTEV